MDRPAGLGRGADRVSGWQDEVAVSNTGTAALTNRTFTVRSWNAALAVGASAAFGFAGSGGRPVNCKLNGLPCDGAAVSPMAADELPLTVSFGQELDFRLTTDGLVQPAPWAAGEPNHDQGAMLPSP